MYAPYQCMHIIGKKYILAASAHELHVFSLVDGSKISSWTCPVPPQPHQTKVAVATNALGPHLGPGSEINKGGETETLAPELPAAPSALHLDPPAKRRKLSDLSEEEEEEEISIEKKNKKGGKSRTKHQKPPADISRTPNVIVLTSSTDGKHVVVVTGEDKTIRVFEHKNGELKQIFQRPMSKRPCAIALAASDSTILCADKFGDVYSLPLLPPKSSQEQDSRMMVSAEPISSPEELKQFVSAANDLTVHSARNRRALQNQLKQKLVKAEKTEMNPGQQLLLGHVSMLTDVAFIERDGRSYIVTADRDEHIRVSRGIPQAHIIEGYCMGHTDFVSKLCFPASVPRLLVSGGGNDDLFAWDWLSGRLLQRTNIAYHIEKAMAHATSMGPSGTHLESTEGTELRKVVVSGLHYLHKCPVSNRGSIVVTCEGIPALFFFSLSEMGNLSHYQTLILDGNPLAVDTDDSSDILIVSVDSVHTPGSTTQIRSDGRKAVEPLQVVQLAGDKWSGSAFHFKQWSVVDAGGHDRESWSGLLYNLGNLRKRGGEE